MKDLLRVGVISNTHGIKGEVKVFPTTDDKKRFQQLKEVLLELEEKTISLEIEQVRFFKQFVLLKFRGIDSIDDVLPYKGKDLLITREDAVPLEEGEYFIYDLIGLTVVTEEGETLGVLQEILTTAANDVYVVAREEGKELLLPAIEECIKEIHIEEKKIIAHLMKGLV